MFLLGTPTSARTLPTLAGQQNGTQAYPKGWANPGPKTQAAVLRPLGHDRDRSERRRRRSLTQLSSPPKQLVRMDPDRSSYLGSNRSRLHRRSNDPLLFPHATTASAAAPTG
jgi:hypothetical protein